MSHALIHFVSFTQYRIDFIDLSKAQRLLKSNSKEHCLPEANTITLLVADDDQDDRYMIREALEDQRLANDIHFVHDGEELMEYLLRRGRYQNPALSPRPGLILLDLNMPKKSGREALREIREIAEIADIPVVILTTSRAEEDILRSYNLGVSGFITKPVTFAGLVEALRDLPRHYLRIVEIPVEN